MILESNGETFEIKLSDLNVSFKLPIKNKKVGGNTSSSDTVPQGTKPKEISVRGIAKFEDADSLKALIKKAEAVNEDGERIVYTLSDKTANLGNVREVIFNNDFNVNKMAKFEAWNVDFTLLEINSTAGRTEALNAPKTSPVADSTTGDVIAPTESSESTESTQPNGFVFDLLTKIEKYLAPDEN